MNTPEIRNLEVRLMHARHEFIKSFEAMQLIVHQINREKGFWIDREAIVRASEIIDENLTEPARRQVIIAALGLVHTETSEAVEAARKAAPDAWGDTKTKDTLVRELAGGIVRSMDLAGHENWRLGDAIVEELLHNVTRPFLHGKKA